MLYRRSFLARCVSKTYKEENESRKLKRHGGPPLRSLIEIRREYATVLNRLVKANVSIY